MNSDGGRWSLLVPVKRLSLAKTRLALPAAVRADLALAMACDTVSAALAADSVFEVVVITDDDRAGTVLASIGARVVEDSPNAGLNPALAHGSSVAAAALVAALSSDLPALRPAELDAVLLLATGHRRSFVADTAGDGTTLLAATAIADFAPAYGPDSRAAHLGSGAVDLSAVAGPSVRHDVDTLSALREAVALGVGQHTTQTLRTHVPSVGR